MNDLYDILSHSGWEPTIGLEVHVQLNTQTKLFSSDANGLSFEPNSNISAVSMGLPGTLPVLNAQALEKAIQFGLAVDAQINDMIHFDRKSYFYPDLPKGFQTTQDKAPICIGGVVEAYSANWQGQKVQLHHTHLEEDAGKSTHEINEWTSIDLNRAGSPLIEIVTAPCIASGDVSVAFLQEIRRIVRFLDISEANMEKGELRCDVNISLKRIDASALGNKVEIKNMNSFNHVKRAIDFELKRQLNLLQSDCEVEIETRTFDPERNKTFGMRFKESLNDYRYFPCPDIPPINISPKMIKRAQEELRKTPSEFRTVFKTQYKLKNEEISFLSERMERATFALTLLALTKEVGKTVNWIKGPITAYCNETSCHISDLPRTVVEVAELINLELEGLLTHSSAQLIFLEMMKSSLTAEQIAEKEGLFINNDQHELERIVSDVLLSLPAEVEKYHKGRKQLLGLFIGEVIKRGGRHLDPKQIQVQLRKELSK